MPAAARKTDPTAHPGTIISGASSVLIGGLAAARVGDVHGCSQHSPNIVTTGSSSVYIEGSAAARVGDLTTCTAPIIAGEASVEIGG